MNNYSNPVTVTGNPASFEASGNGKLLSLSVPFSPIQDLHGYDNPWPGGGGKNIAHDVVYKSETGQYKTVISASYTVKQGKRYIFSWMTPNTGVQIYRQPPQQLGFDSFSTHGFTCDGTRKSMYGTASADATFTGKSIIAKSATTEEASGLCYDFMIEEVADNVTAPSSYAPYSNICPITGRTGLNVYRTGKNLCVPDLANGQIGSNGGYSSNTSRLTNAVRVDNAYVSNTYLTAGTYTLSVDGLTQCTVLTKDASANIIDNFATAWHNLPYTFTMTAAGYVYFTVRKSSGNLNPDDYKVQIESGSTATTYEPYNGNTYAVDWTSEAGTVYGGTLDVVTGVLTVNKKYFTKSGDVLLYGNWGNDNAPLYYFLIDTTIPIKMYADTQDDGYILSNYFSATTGVGPESMKNNEIRTRDNTPDRLYFRWDSAGSLADINAAFAENPLQIVAELATPITYQLTPTQIALILGQNNVWSDSNEAVTLTYVIELFTRYTFIVNGNDYTGLVERDSYRTAVTPVYGETIQTLDGVGHTALLRVKGSLTVKLNPQTAAQTAAICADLLNAPCEVQYKCLQRNVNVTALMVLDVVSAMFLSRCLYLGQKWNDVDEIVLKEL